MEHKEYVAVISVGNIVRVSHISQVSEIITKHEKGGKYLSTLHEATCDNYFIVKCLLKSNVARVILLTC